MAPKVLLPVVLAVLSIYALPVHAGVEGVDFGLVPPVMEGPIKGLPEGPLAPVPKLDPIQPTALEYECFQLANQARANPSAYGYSTYAPAPPLHWNAALLYIGWVHSKHMYENNYFEHDSFSRVGGELVFQRTWADRVKSVYSFNVQISENIAWNTSGSAEEILTTWMNSPPHRNTLLNPAYTEGAIGAFGGSDKVYFTHDFGARSIVYNLAISAANITLDPPSPQPGQTVRVQFTIANTGSTDAFPVEVQLHRRPPGGAWTSQTAVMWMKYILPGGTSSTAYIDIDTTGMPRGTEIRVDVDPNNRFVETSEADNSAVLTLIPGGVDPPTPSSTPTPSRTPTPTLTPIGTHPPTSGPDLVWSTYLGGSMNDRGRGVAVDGSGNIYVTGFTDSTGWTSGGFDVSYNGGESDAFVVKLSPGGAHIWSTYLGGATQDRGRAIAVDGSGNVYVTGYTDSPGWVSGGYDVTHNGDVDGFIVKLSSSGAHLWSTYFGGPDRDESWDIEIDGSGNIVTAGRTRSPGWISGGFDASHNGELDAFVAKFSPNGTPLWSTYLGGSETDTGWGIDVDALGNVYTAGYTESVGWTSGGFDTTYSGGRDGFVAKLSSNGEHVWSTYLGGSGLDEGRSVAVDAGGAVHVIGLTHSPGWVANGFDTSYNGEGDVFVAKLSTHGAHLWSSYLGGASEDSGEDIAVDSAGNAYLIGNTGSAGWPSGGFDTQYSGLEEAFVAKVSPAGSHLWSSYLGGDGNDYGYHAALSETGHLLAAGTTYSAGWVSGGYNTVYQAGGDAFVAKIRISGEDGSWCDANRDGQVETNDLLMFLKGAAAPPVHSPNWLFEFSTEWKRRQ